MRWVREQIKINEIVEYMLVFLIILIFNAVRIVNYFPAGIKTPDSYYYLQQFALSDGTSNFFVVLFSGMTQLEFMFVTSVLISIAMFGFYYTVLKRFMSVRTSLIMLVFLVFSPLLHLNTALGNFDKNIMEIIFIFFILSLILENTDIGLLLGYLISIIVLASFSKLYLAVVVLLILSYVIHKLLNIDVHKIKSPGYILSMLVGIIILLCFIILGFNEIIFLLIPKFKTVTELMPIFVHGVFVEMILGLFVFIKIIVNWRWVLRLCRLRYVYCLLFTWFMITFIGTVMCYRLNILLLPVLFVLFGFFIEDYIKDSEKSRDFSKYCIRLVVIIMLFVFMLLFGSGLYNLDNVTERGWDSAVKDVKDSDSDCVYSMWDWSHPLNYELMEYNKSAVFKGHVKNEDNYEFFVEGEVKYDYYIDCTILWHENDYGKLNAIANLKDEYNYTNKTDTWIYGRLDNFTKHGEYYVGEIR